MDHMRPLFEKNRREFLHTAACAVCIGALAPFISSCDNPADPPVDTSLPLIEGAPVIDLSVETGLHHDGAAVKKRFSAVNSGKTVIVVRLTASTYTAFAAQCTHQGTEIGLPSNSVMICPNHGSKFNANTGAVVQGPAAAALTKFNASFDSGKNTVTLS